MIILGLNAFHADSSAALLRDGQLVAAVEEERFRRVKHWAGFPAKSIACCLDQAGITLAQVDHIAVNQDNGANLFRKIGHVVSRRPNLNLILGRLRNRRGRERLPQLVVKEFPGQTFNGRFHRVEHHLAHLSSSFHASPFDKAAVVSVDGFGDFASAAWGAGDGTNIGVEGRVYFPHSLGIFYQALTQYLGFPRYGDEFKVMGLAPYGLPSFIGAMREIVRLKADGGYALNLDYFRHHREPVDYQWANGAPEFGDLFAPALETLLGPRRRPDDPLEDRHHDIARSMQDMYEEAFFHLLTAVAKKSGLTDLALAGGCAMNSVANGKVKRKTPFRRVYVPAAAGDAGGAIGAALTVWHGLGNSRSFVMQHAYWGPQFFADEIARLLSQQQSRIAQAGCTIEIIPDELALCRRVASAITDGKIVGWFQGRGEWGPRALGNRSILCDPRRADMKTILNERIKRRESFRPFAPAILEADVSDWFEENGAVPFMSQVFQIRNEKRSLIPAVAHIDGSGRLQTVSRRSNPRFHRLIEAFRDLTDVPMLLNTSFNENEPMVWEPIQALDCFLRTKMDLLVLGDTIVFRPGENAL